MTVLLSLIVLASPGAVLENLLTTHGWGVVSVDQKLVNAANELARRVGTSRGGREPKALGKTIQFLLAKHRLSDANVTPFIFNHDRHAPNNGPMSRLLARLERRIPPTHYGLGRHIHIDQTTVVILLVHRGVQLTSPLPRHLKTGDKLIVSGHLRRGYFRPRVIVAPPGNRSIEERPAWTSQRTVDAEIVLDSGPGRYGVEIVADSQYGPVVLNNHVVYSGISIPTLPVVRLQSPLTSGSRVGEQQRLLSALNRLRSEIGVSILREDARLTQAALEHATEMAKRKTVTHTSPNTGTLVMRLRRLGLDPLAVAENLAQASDATTALHAFKDSPGHARNLVLPGMTHVGIGVVGQYFAVTFARLPQLESKTPSIGNFDTPK